MSRADRKKQSKNVHFLLQYQTATMHRKTNKPDRIIHEKTRISVGQNMSKADSKSKTVQDISDKCSTDVHAEQTGMK